MDAGSVKISVIRLSPFYPPSTTLRRKPRRASTEPSLPLKRIREMRIAPRFCRVENSGIHGKSSRRIIRNAIEEDHLSGPGEMACDRSPRIGGEAGLHGADGSLAGMAPRVPVGGNADWPGPFSKNGEWQTMRVTNAGQTPVRGGSK